jgi:glycosyltransferase involved in cell wall biosynthesis
MKKVLIIGLTPPLEGGSQQHIFEIVKRLNKKKFDITVLTQKASLCKKYARCIEIPLKNKPGYGQSFEFFSAVKKMLYAFKEYDIIHLQENYLFLLIPALKRITSAKIIATVHGMKGFKYYDNKVLWWIFKNKLKKADRIIAISPTDKLLLEKISNNVTYIPNGVDISAYKGRAKINKKIVFIGRIHEQKGVIYLLRAFETLSREFPEFKLEIIGKLNEYSAELKKQFPDKRIVWKGYVSNRKEIAKELKSAYCIVLPSLWEGLPLTLLESLASQRPVITTSLPVISMIVNNQKNCILVSPKNSDEIIETVTYFVNNPASASKIGKQGKLLSQNYSWGAITNKLAKIYGEKN